MRLKLLAKNDDTTLLVWPDDPELVVVVDDPSRPARVLPLTRVIPMSDPFEYGVSGTMDVIVAPLDRVTEEWIRRRDDIAQKRIQGVILKHVLGNRDQSTTGRGGTRYGRDHPA